MTDILTNMTQLARKSTDQESYQFIFMKVKEIISEKTGLTFAYGLDILSGEQVAVRLNSIDETAEDLVKEKKYNTIDEAKFYVTNQYHGRNSRETLDKKRDQRHATYLSFEKCIKLPENPYSSTQMYRSHWSKTMSSRTDIEFVMGLANISCVDERNIQNSSGKVRAAATVIEYVRYLKPNNSEENLKIITHALRNRGKNLLREGCTKVCLMENEKIFATFTIKQAQIIETGLDAYNQKRQYTIPADIHQTLTSFLAPHDRVNEFAVSKDIARLVMHVYCEKAIDWSSFSSSDNDYINEVKSILTKLQNGTIKVKVFGMRVLRFGNELITKLLPTGKFDPLLMYKYKLFDENGKFTNEYVDAYIPTIFAIQHAPHDRRFIIFKERMYYYSEHGRSNTLDKIDIDLNNQPMRTIDPNNL